MKELTYEIHVPLEVAGAAPTTARVCCAMTAESICDEGLRSEAGEWDNRWCLLSNGAMSTFGSQYNEPP